MVGLAYDCHANGIKENKKDVFFYAAYQEIYSVEIWVFEISDNNRNWDGLGMQRF